MKFDFVVFFWLRSSDILLLNCLLRIVKVAEVEV